MTSFWGPLEDPFAPSTITFRGMVWSIPLAVNANQTKSSTFILTKCWEDIPSVRVLTCYLPPHVYVSHVYFVTTISFPNPFVFCRIPESTV